MRASIVRYCKKTDLAYLLLCMLLSGISVVTLCSVAQYGGLDLGGALGNMRVVYVQVMAAVLGIAGAVVLSLVDYRRLLELWPIHAALCWGLVLLTFIPGVGYEPPGTGSQSWIAMPLGMSFQPTELAKLSFMLTFAGHLDRVHDTLNRPLPLLGLLAHLGAPVLLVHLQGDDGTALVFLAIGLVMLVGAGLNRWVVSGSVIAVAAAAPYIWNRVMSPYQKDRILGLLNPTAYEKTVMHQQIRGRAAIGAGRVSGIGLFAENHSYVPRAENDFIFSYFAESCGFLGCIVLLALLFGLLFRTLGAARRSANRAGAFLCVGVFAVLLYQSVVNIGMNVMLLPVMGVTLPFLSAGGTSVMALYLAVGLVLSVGRHQRKGLFED